MFMIFGTPLCKWILIILVNLLRCVPCTSLTVHVTVTNHHAAVRDAIFYPARDVATPSPNSPDLNPVDYLGYPSRECLPFSDLWCEGVERTSAEQVEAAGPHHHHRSDGVVVWMHVFAWMVDIVNINFEPDFLLCFVCFIDTGFRKCDRYKRAKG